MSLTEQLANFKENFVKNAPPQARDAILSTTDDFKASYKLDQAIQVGDKLPEFRLSDATGKEVASKELLAQGPILISFYRGEWCPYCNIALSAWQKHLDTIKAKGVTLVAISPELPNTSLSTTEKHELKFPVLSDVGNKFAGELGILYPQSDVLRPIFKAFGNDLNARNGDDSFVVPVPATILVDQSGVVRNTFIDADYTKRVDPVTALGWIDKL